jgi:RNA polymerase sigma-70 factor (sigma-E family)
VFHRVVLSYQRDLVTDAADVAVDVALDPYVGSFDTFVRERGAGLCRLAYLLTGDHQLAEDLVQTALAKVAPKWDRIAGKGDPGPYVRQVMLRTTIGWRRRRWHGETPTAPLPERHEADATGAVETRERIRTALMTLPARQRAVVVLRFYDDRSEADVAALLGCKVGTVKSQASRALAKLRDVLGDGSTAALPISNGGSR